MKTVFRYIIVLGLSFILAILIDTRISDFFMSTIFSVSGIMFSLGLGLIVTINTNGIKNKDFLALLRQNLKKVRNSFIFNFAVVVISYISSEIMRNNFIPIILLKKTINWDVFFMTIIFYSIIYFIINFLEIQRLNDDIFDELNK